MEQRRSKLLTYFGWLYLAVHTALFFLMCIFTVAGDAYPGAIVFIVPAFGVCSGYWIIRRNFCWWRNIIVVASITLSVAIVFTSVYLAPKMDHLKHQKFLEHTGAGAMPKPVVRDKEPGLGNEMSMEEILVDMDEVAPVPSRSDLQGQLLQALGNDDVAEASRLLNIGASPHVALTPQGITPIMAAESASMAQMLLDLGADPAATDAEGGNVLHYAVTRPNAPELIRLFTSFGANPNLRGWGDVAPIFVAADYFYESGAIEPDVVVSGDTGSDEITTQPHRATPGVVLAALVSSGANINEKDDSDNTLLMNATVQNSGEMVKLLLELGADKSVTDSDGKTASDFAYELGHRYIYQLLE